MGEFKKGSLCLVVGSSIKGFFMNKLKQDKTIFFTKLHADLAEKYNLLPEQIRNIRSLSIPDVKIREWCLWKTTLKRKHGRTKPPCRKKNKKYYFDLANWLRTATKEQIADIKQKTKYDK